MGWQLSLLVRCRAWDGKQHRLGGEIGMALYRQVLPGRYWLNSSPSRWHNIHFNSLGMKSMWSSIPVILILNINDSTFILLAIQIALIAKSAIITHLTTQYAQVVKSLPHPRESYGLMAVLIRDLFCRVNGAVFFEFHSK